MRLFGPDPSLGQRTPAPAGSTRLGTAGRIVAGAATLAFAVVAPLAGCRGGDMCFLKVCVGKNCRCSLSSCGEGAGFDIQQNRCRCLKGHIPVAGQCLTKPDADAYCGLGRHWEDSGCAQDTCRPGDEIDQRTGLCVPREQVNQVASGMGVSVGQGEVLGCPEGTRLIVDGPTAACVPLSQTCAPDETWTGQACAKSVRCATGSIWDPQRGQCVQYAQGSSSDELLIDVASWVTASYGPAGGTGTASFCSGFANKPLSFGILEGSTAVVRVAITLAFPDREIAKGVSQTVSVFDASGNPVPAKGAADVDAAARQIATPLILGGGRASAQSATTTVKCPVTHAAKPRPVPAVGGI
ncbi:hypothetical protein [Chondromyces crocatus]|uniref:Uncharacterized protein n=1 Tax=Chondromyces crocatus TaxID=52 RepID=A0A0K1EG11_CHOCO|nr:hypothetical protein [Chondromyces crocatus]AKT39784.1 uncharacterized protein CMC5_039350 [Chondromyces crocatus]